MAKTTNPLMSQQASGTFKRLITFDKSGVAHFPNVPGTNKAASQGNARQIFKAISQALQQCAPAIVSIVKSETGCGPNWRAFLTDLISGVHHFNWDAIAQYYTDQSSDFRAAWQNAAIAQQFKSATLPYATDPLITAGLSLFELSSTLYSNNIITTPGAPAIDNAIAWAQAITGVSIGADANALTLNGEVLTLADQILTLGYAGTP